MRSSRVTSAADRRSATGGWGPAMEIGAECNPLYTSRQAFSLTIGARCNFVGTAWVGREALVRAPGPRLHLSSDAAPGGGRGRMAPHGDDRAGGDDWPGKVAADALPAWAVRTITEQMEAQGLTQKELGEQLGVTETTVSRWLRRRAAMPLSTLARVGELLGETPGRLLDGARGDDDAALRAAARSLFAPPGPAAGG